jgi:hypothetical protein
MPRFMALHTLPPKGMTLQQVKDFARIAQEDKIIKGQQSFGNLAEGKVVCICDAPSKNDLANFFERKGMPVDNIVQLEFEGQRGTINPV